MPRKRDLQTLRLLKAVGMTTARRFDQSLLNKAKCGSAVDAVSGLDGRRTVQIS
jgi:hypothetical protein